MVQVHPLMSAEGPLSPTEDLLRHAIADGVMNPSERALPAEKKTFKADGGSSQAADRRLSQVDIYPPQADMDNSQANISIWDDLDCGSRPRAV